LNKDKDNKTQSTEEEREENENEDTNEDIRIKLHPSTWSEIKRALKEIKSGKAQGTDNICPETLKLDTKTIVNLLHPLLTEIWKKEKFPTDCKEGLKIKIPKKGAITKCNNWRGITLLSIPSKLFSRILLNRIKNVVELHLRKEQAGFRRQHSCVDLINTMRIILEQSNEFQTTLYLTFIDFEKAFDSINRRIMWQTLTEYGILKKFLSLI
jgi:hypothetical protein